MSTDHEPRRSKLTVMPNTFAPYEPDLTDSTANLRAAQAHVSHLEGEPQGPEVPRLANHSGYQDERP